MLDWIITCTLLVGFIALGVFANWRSGKPWDDMKPKRVPWNIVMLAAVFGLVVTLVHLANLVGIETGPDKSPFGRF